MRYEVKTVAISPNGQTIASGLNSYIFIHDIPAGKIVRRLSLPMTNLVVHSGGVNSIAISPDGQTLASCGGGDKTIKLWKIVNGLGGRHAS